jgi:hypothetical protein
MKVRGSSLNDTDPTERTSLAFGEVFIDSPNAGSVSSMDSKSDWVITSCSASSDQPQSVRLLFPSVYHQDSCSSMFAGSSLLFEEHGPPDVRLWSRFPRRR